LGWKGRFLFHLGKTFGRKGLRKKVGEFGTVVGSFGTYFWVGGIKVKNHFLTFGIKLPPKLT